MPIGKVKKVSHTILIVLILALCLFLAPSLAWSATLTWTGDGGSSSFNNAGNWNPAQIPTVADDCIINSTNTNQPGITQNAECGSLTLGTGGTVMTLSFATTRNLTIAGDVTIGPNGRVTNSGGSASGTFTVGGDWSDDLATANIDTSGSLLITYLFNGTNKTITTNNETFHNMEIFGDISLNGDMTVENRFRISGGIFTQGPNTLTLNGNFFNISSGTYNHDCSSTVVINGRITMANNDRYPNTIVNSTGRLEGPNTGFIDCDLTIQAGGELLPASNFFVEGDWINNGGTITIANDAVHMTGAGAQIAGTTPTTFYDLTIGNGAGDSTTAVQNITIDNNLTVTAGTDFTLQAGTDITLTGGSATIDGTVSFSGTSTWYQAGAGSGITVNPGGSISAQGTDAANRVTFTRSDASYYDFIIQGGIDFNNVNVYYSGTADKDNGFTINGAGVVNFNTVAFEFTEDVNNAVMMYWDSPQSIMAQGCTFDSATYAPGDGDVNVEAVQGEIVFVNYGGNYGGEALDNDNGGVVLWDPAVTSAVAEIDPNSVTALSTGNSFTYDILPTLQPWDTGVDQIVITAPVGYTNLNVTGVSVGGSSHTANCPAPGVNEYCAAIAGQAITVLLGSKITISLTIIQISFDADAPVSIGSANFTSTVDDTSTGTSPQATTPGDADGDAGDANSQTVDVTSGGVINWIGGVSTDFGNPNNWGPALPPSTALTCIIDSYTNFQPSLLSNESCGELILGTGATLMTLTFTGSNNLTVTGDVTIGANGRMAESGLSAGAVFYIGGSWSDDLATTNFTNPNIPLQFIFSGTNETISTSENLYDVQITGSYALSSDLTIGNSLNIAGTANFTHGPNTITHNGDIFVIGGTYNHTCSSTLILNGAIGLQSNRNYANVILNNGAVVTGSNPATIDCDLTTQSGSTFNYGVSLFLEGDWINNGATLNSGSGTVTMTGAGAEIRGTAPVPFNNLIIGNEAGDSTTALVDISMSTDFDVSMGTTFTLQSGRDIAVSGIATIDGEVYISGNSTWLQSGINNGIQVNSGGLLSAQGTDDANRVTFDWLAGIYYDVDIDGGIDFNYVNLLHTNSARQANKGMRINTPAGETLIYNKVAINDTNDEPSAVMLAWNSPQTVTCNRCSFDSSTFSPANDVNVEVLQGEIIFFGYGGNFAGEALDDDNGGIATWITITTTIGDGTAPSNKIVAVNSTNNAVNAFTLSTDNGTDTLTDLTVTFTGTDVNDVSASGVKLYEDNGSIANEWDSSDTAVTNGTASFSGATANFTGLNISINTTPTQYLITYDIAPTAATGNTLLGAVTAATVTDSLINNDTTDATLTVGGCQVVITADSGAGSLRNCIDYANLNAGTTISFNIPDTDPGYQSSGGDNWWRIAPAIALPTIAASGTIIDGTTQAANYGSDTNSRGPEIELDGSGAGAGVDGLWIEGGDSIVRGLIINRFGDEGITLITAGNNIVEQNYIGTDATGTSTAGTGNVGNGISIRTGSTNNIIGGPGVGNVIGGNNLDGIRTITSGNVIQGNFVGIDVAGTIDLGNGQNGILISSASNNTVGGTGAGDDNIIAHNGGDGVWVTGASSDSNQISGNSIFENTGLGIDLGLDGPGATNGANNDKTAPIINSITLSGVNYVINVSVTSGDTVEFFRVDNAVAPVVNVDPSGSGEGYLFLGSCPDNGTCSGPHLSAVVDGDGAGGVIVATLLPSGVVGGDSVSSTATDASNNTSEFSANFVVPLTFCNASIGSNIDNSGYANDVGATKCTSPANANTLTEISVYTDASDDDVCLAIYADSAGYPGFKIAQGCNASGSGWGWHSAPVSACLSPNTVYWLAFTDDDGGYDYRYNAGAANEFVKNNPNNYPTLPDPYPGAGTYYARSYSIYATYTTAGCIPSITGRVFEDVDYAGGAGTAYDGGVTDAGLSGVEVELYDASDNWVRDADALTAADGSYVFTNVPNGTYKVRVRSATITVKGAGTLPEQTYEHDGAAGNGSNGALGGNDSQADDTATGDNAAGDAGDTNVTVTVSSASVAGVDFGFSYNLVSSAKDTGQGSLRQFITNANTIAGSDSVEFMIASSADSLGRAADPNFAAGVATINPAIALPDLNDATGGTIIDGQTQIDNIGDTNNPDPAIVIDGTSTTNENGIVLTSNGNEIRKLIIQAFDFSGVSLSSNSDSNIIADNISQQNEGHGIRLTEFNDTNQILNNTIQNNGSGASTTSRGIYFVSPTNFSDSNTVDGNTVQFNANDGINAVGTTGSTFSNNTVNGNGVFDTSGRGIRLSDATGNTILNNQIYDNNAVGIALFSSSSSNTVEGNTIYNNGLVDSNDHGIWIISTSNSNIIQMNAIYRNNGDGIRIGGSSTGTKIYHNTVHGNGQEAGAGNGSGIIIGAGSTGTIVRNNIFSVNDGFGVDASEAITNSYNDFYTNVSGDCNGCTPGTGSLASDPLYVNAPGGDFTLTECTSPAINAGIDLGGDQPDMNGAAAGLWNNNAPEQGAFETTSACVPSLSIIKQTWLPGGAAPLGSPVDIPTGMKIVFLIYVKNTTAGQITDVRITDNLDETGFQYVAGSLFRDDGSITDASTDLQIFNATASGTGVNLSDAVDPPDIGSAQDTGGLADVDLITVGQVPAQTNGNLNINGNTTFAIRFEVIVK
jgi:parallel beta-helix repeat protein